MVEYINIKDKDALYKRLKELEPLNLATHHDADGVYSAVLLSKVFDIQEVSFPEEFGDYDDPVTVATDVGQSPNPEWSGICFDHHPHDMTDRKYALVRDHVPTGGVVYEALKEHIDPKWSWLAVGAYVGDGQSELIPPEIFERHPSLLEGRASIYQSYGKTSVYEYALYSLISSPINATCRTNKPYNAYRILKTCRTPDDVKEHPLFKEDQEILNMEYDKIIAEYGKDKKVRRSAYIVGNFMVLPFQSKYAIASRLSSSLSPQIKGKTLIAINTETGAISIRGDLAYWLLMKMVPLGWKMGGHAGYCGGSLLKNGKTAPIDEFMEDLRSATKR